MDGNIAFVVHLRAIVYVKHGAVLHHFLSTFRPLSSVTTGVVANDFDEHTTIFASSLVKTTSSF